MPEGKIRVPSLYGLSPGEVTQTLNDLGLYLQAKGTDSTAWHVLATKQDIPPGTEVERGSTISVTFTDTKDLD
jgi:beta-lactam-binding protein with PASTA domain